MNSNHARNENLRPEEDQDIAVPGLDIAADAGLREDGWGPSDRGAPAATAPPVRIAVAFATIGRPEVIIETIAEMRAQTRRPDVILVAAPAEKDVVGLADRHPDVLILIGRLGSSPQRNHMLENVATEDIVVFLDDDFVPSPRYLEFVEQVFVRNPDVAMTTGRVVADGILGPGFDFPRARAMLDATAHEPYDADDVREAYNGYGCNMAARLDLVRRHDIRFDENLPLYAWLEDVDFSRQLAGYGRIVKTAATRGVHLGVKRGRQTGTRLGYSQIANPIYLMRKGTCSPRKALMLAGRNVMANLLKSLVPEPYVDRRGRLSGNSRAFFDLLTGRLDPGRVLSL